LKRGRPWLDLGKKMKSGSGWEVAATQCPSLKAQQKTGVAEFCIYVDMGICDFSALRRCLRDMLHGAASHSYYQYLLGLPYMLLWSSSLPSF